MRLLRQVQTAGATTSTDFSLGEYFPPKIPPRYAILSHRWGADEVTLEDFKTGVVKTKAGYKKLEFCARQAATDGIDCFWVDTCCIDKANHTELSEAINSMFRWYQNAAKCYVYLPDVSSTGAKRDINSEAGWKAAFRRSVWFTRGWTLQELIAPTVVEFFSTEGEPLGDKCSLEQEICQITKIAVDALRGQPLATFEIEERLAWAAGRDTTREEDTAYCLLGIFNVYMPLIYGEGRENATARLKGSFHNLHAEERKCHQSLKTSPYEAYKDRNPVRVPGTCQWVLSHPRFCDWRSDQGGALLWISADPGCGKSVLCRSLIDQDLRCDGRTSVCYFFFKDNGEQDNLAPALCAVLHQLFVQQPQLLRHAISVWKTDGVKLQHETQQLWKILSVCAADPNASPIICVFDALDECQDTDRRRLIEMLCRLHRSQGETSSQKLKVLVTSRPYDNVQRWFAPTAAQWPQIRLRGEDENDRIRQEINLVIEQQVQDLATEFDLPLADHQYLRQQLLQMQHRTYLWLYLAMEEVREACRESIFNNSLQIQSLPSSVEDAYERMLRKIGDRQRLLARRVLLIIVGARRPFAIREMAMALSAAHAAERDLQKLDMIDTVRLEKHIREQCGLFVYIQDSHLFLIHQTAKEFLMASSTELSHAPGRWKSSLSIRTIENEMARFCMTYLCLESQQECLSDPDVHDKRSVSRATHQPGSAQLNSFFQYCAENWTSHLQDDMLKGEDKLMRQALRLYKAARPTSSSWFPYAWRSSKVSSGSPPDMQIQHMIAMFGHATVLDEVWSHESIDLEERDSKGGTALYWAAGRGHEKVVQMLLEMGANVNAKGGDYGNALCAASIGHYEKVVQILLDNGADIEAQGKHREGKIGDLTKSNALQMSSAYGYEKIVQILLQNRANVNAQGGYYSNALQAASANGHEKVVQILLDKGADVNAQGGYHGNTLCAASIGGDEKVVQMLLSKGADIEAQGKYYDYTMCKLVKGNALQVSSARGYEKVIQILLNKGANVNTQEGHYGNALQAASVNGHEKAVQILLYKGADVNAQGGYYGNALQAASETNQIQVVRILLRRVVDVGIGLESALHALGYIDDIEVGLELLRELRVGWNELERVEWLRCLERLTSNLARFYHGTWWRYIRRKDFWED